MLSILIIIILFILHISHSASFIFLINVITPAIRVEIKTKAILWQHDLINYILSSQLLVSRFKLANKFHETLIELDTFSSSTFIEAVNLPRIGLASQAFMYLIILSYSFKLLSADTSACTMYTSSCSKILVFQTADLQLLIYQMDQSFLHHNRAATKWELSLLASLLILQQSW